MNSITSLNDPLDQLQLRYERITCLMLMHNQLVCWNNEALMAPGVDGNYVLL